MSAEVEQLKSQLAEARTEIERLKSLLASEQASHRNLRGEMISDPIISGVLTLRNKIGFMQLVIDGSKLDDEQDEDMSDAALDEMMRGNH